MSTIDHSAEAQKHYEEAVTANRENKWETARFEMQLAKFHTESALVERQRIGNLLAYAALLESQYRESAIHPDEFNASTKQASLDRHKVTLQLIREGLGL